MSREYRSQVGGVAVVAVVVVVGDQDGRQMTKYTGPHDSLIRVTKY